MLGWEGFKKHIASKEGTTRIIEYTTLDQDYVEMLSCLTVFNGMLFLVGKDVCRVVTAEVIYGHMQRRGKFQ